MVSPREKPETDIGGELLSLLGEDATLNLINEYGGQVHRVPLFKSDPATKKFSELVGERTAALLVERFGGQTLAFPIMRSWRIQILRARGMSYNQIAKEMKITTVTVHKALQERGMTNAGAPQRVRRTSKQGHAGDR